MVTTLPSIRRDGGGGGGSGGHHRCGSGGGGNGTHKRQPSKSGSALGCTCTNCPCLPRDPVKEQLCSAKMELLKMGPQCLQPLAIPAPLPPGDFGETRTSPRAQEWQGQPERRGHRRPRRESSGKEDAEVQASMKRGVLLGVLPAPFKAPAEESAAAAPEEAAAAAAAAAAAGTDLEAPLSSSAASAAAGGKAERKEEHTDGEEDEDEAEAEGREEEERKASGGVGLGLGVKGSPGWWQGRAEAYEEEEEAMWSYFAQANPRERSRMLMLRDHHRLEKLLMLTRNVVLAGLAASSKPASPRGDEKAGAADDSSSSGGNSSRPARPEECFITGRSMRHSVHLVSEAQAQLFCCPCVTGAGPGGRGQPQQPPLRGLSPPGGGGGNSSSSKPFELGPKEPALDIVCLPTKEIPTGKEEGGQQPPATEEGAGATAEAAPLSWLDEEDAAVDGAAEWLLQQCLFFSSGAGGPGAASDKKASSSAVSSSSLGGGAGASEVSGSHTVMVFSSAALLDVPRLRAAVELLVERQVWFIPSDTLAPHLGPLPPSAAAAAAARNGGSLPTGFPVTALTLPAFLARWVLAALRYHWLTTTAGFPTPCPCRTRALGASSAARALAPGAAARKAPLCTAGLLLAGREDEQQQQRGDTLAYLRVAALGSSAASSCCSASCCSSSPSSASYYGFGAEAMMEMWHGMAREERLALLRRLEKAIGEEIKAHLSKAGGSGSGGPKGGKSNGGGSSSSSTSSSSNAALPSEAALPTPRRVLLHALGLVLRPDGADGGSELGAAAESEEEQLATLAEDEAVGEVLLEGLCLFRLPQVYVVASPRPALTPHLALALKHALESFYADELARRLILEEEEEEQELQKGAGGGRKGRGGGEGCSKSSAKKLRRKEKLRTWLLKRQQEEQVQQAESKAQPAAASASASSAVASSPEQPIPRRPAAVVEEDAATPVHEEREAEGKDGTEGAEPSALHSRSLSADDSINPEAPKAVAAAAVAAAAATGKGDAAGEESEKGLVGISRSTSEGSAPGTGACSPTSEVEDEEEEEDGHRSSYTTSPSGSSSSGSSSANSSTGSASAASSNSPSPTAGGPFVEPTHQGEAAEPATSACSTGRATGRAMGALLPPPPLVIDADTGAGSGAGQEQGLVPEAEAGGYYYGYEHGYPEGYAEYGREAEAEAEAEAEWSASVGRRLQLCARLSWELDDMAMGLREVAARRRPWQYCALTHLEQVVGLLWPKAHCEVYGSFTTGLSIPASDLDVVITHLPLHSRGGGGSGAGSSCSAPGAHLLSELNDFLGAQDWVASVHCVRHAAMPIIKLTTAPMPLHMTDRPGGEAEAAGEGPDGVPRGVIKIDISLDVPGMSERASGSGGGGGEAGEEDEEAEAAEEKGQAQGHQHHHQHQQQEAPVHYGLQSSMFVQRLCVVHPQLPPLVLVLKQLLLQRGLSDSYTGGLSSYALSIMVAAILQPYVLEPPEMQPNLGALFLTFLQTYGTATFDTGRFGVCLAPPPYGPLFALTGEHGGGGLDEQSRSWKPTDPVVIQDPLCAANNVGRSCFGFRQVQVVFDQCLSRLLLYGERILAEEEARAARLMGGASQWQQQKKAAANAGALIGSTEGGHDEGKEGEGGESEGAEPVTAESVLGIALFGASHHRHVVDLAAASLCPPASSMEPRTAALSSASLAPAPGPAGSGSGPLSPPLGLFTFHQPHQPLPQPLPFIFAVPCAAAPGVPPGAFYQWTQLPMGMHLPTIVYAPAPAPHAAFLPFPAEHLPCLHHPHAPPLPPEWCGGAGVMPPPPQHQRVGHNGPRGGGYHQKHQHYHHGPRRHQHSHHRNGSSNAVAGAGAGAGGASPRYDSPRRERREGAPRGERDGGRRRAAGAGEGQYQYQPRRQQQHQHWESRSGPVTPTPSVGMEGGEDCVSVGGGASAEAVASSSVQA